MTGANDNTESANSASFPVLRGRAVRVDSGGLFCLDDIWLANGSPKNLRPAQWRRLPLTAPLIAEVTRRNVGKSHTLKKCGANSVIYSLMGRSGGTYADLRLALAYAEYLNPRLATEVREVFLRFANADPTLADDVLQRASAEANEWAGRRAIGRTVRKGYTGVLSKHGVNEGIEFAHCTNALYQGLYGKSARQLKNAKGTSGSLRDAMSASELAFVTASEALAAERIEEQGCQGPTMCGYASLKSASAIRKAIEADRRDRRSRATG